MNLNTSLRGQYRLRAYNPATGESRDTDWFDNLITNNGLDMIGTIGSWGVAGNCVVGTGNTTPAFTDTALANQVMVTQSWTGNPMTPVAPDFIAKYVWTFTFAASTANYNLAEIGVRPTYENGPLFSRALIVDAGGQPTTFTVLTGEILFAQYRVWLYTDLSLKTQTVNISGTNYTVTSRPMHMTNSQFGFTAFQGGGAHQNFQMEARCMGAGVGLPADVTFTNSSSGIGVANTGNVLAYTPGSKYRDINFVFPISTPVEPIRTVYLSLDTGYHGGHRWAFEFNPIIPKSADNTLTLTFRYSWDRYVP